MTSLRNLVHDALKDKNPVLFKELQARGSLNEFLDERTEEIQDAIQNRAREIAQWQGYNQLLQTDPMKAVGVMNQALGLAREEVLAEMLAFPQDEISQPRPAETMRSAMPT